MRFGWEPQSRRQQVASNAGPGFTPHNCVGEERSIHKPNRSHRVAGPTEALSNDRDGTRIVGFAGCDSDRLSEVANRLRVAGRRGSFN